MIPAITHLRHVGLLSPDIAKHQRFYADLWGLDIVRDEPETVYFRGRADESFVLSLHASARPGLHHIAFGMASVPDIRRAAEILRRQGLRFLTEPEPLATPGGGFGFAFIDPEGRRIELSANAAPNREEFSPRPCEPISICHVVLNTPDIDRSCAFYTGTLGFRVSDWSEHQMVFIRTNSKHHNVSFFAAPHASLNHVAYLVDGVDALMRGMSNLRQSGVEPAWGPGRHGPGNNVFCYFKDPLGYVAEYTCDIDQIRDEAAHTPRVWPRTPELMDLWGTAGPPSADVRAAMAGIPDPGWSG